MSEKELRERFVVLRSRVKGGRSTAKYYSLSSVAQGVGRSSKLVVSALYYPPGPRRGDVRSGAPSLPLKNVENFLLGHVPEIVAEKAEGLVSKIVPRKTEPAIEESEHLFREWPHGTEPPSPKQLVQRWLRREKRRGEEHYRLVLNLGDERGGTTLGELVRSQRWDEALAIIRRVDHW